MVDNIPPQLAWDALNSDADARLVDVRTEAEWHGVGVPNIEAAGKETVLLPWQFGPGQRNPAFLEGLAAAGLKPEQKLYFICRSGARSMAAAEAAGAAGYKAVFNVADGYEGGQSAPGWKSQGLPWRWL